MNIAYNLTRLRQEDISNLYNGDNHLFFIAGDDFKCSDSSCNAEVILCSYAIHNLVAPYFKTKINHSHRDGCENTVVEFQYDDSDVLSSRNVGESAFNAMRRRFTSSSEREISLYNTTSGTRTLIPRVNGENIRTRTSVKTGVILYDGTSEIKSNVTYLSSLSDVHPIITRRDDITFLNFAGVGLMITQQTSEIISENINNSTIVFLAKNVKKKNNRQFSSRSNILIIKNNELVHEQTWRDFNW